MAIAYKSEYEEHRRYVIPHSSRMIEECFKMHGPPLVLLSCYAPHMGRQIEEREAFFNLLGSRCNDISRKVELIAVGDFNTRFQARRDGEDAILGSSTFGRGKDYMEQCEGRVTEASNRELCTDMLWNTGMVARNTFFIKTKRRKSHLPRNRHRPLR